LKTSVLWNKGGGQFALTALPWAAQQTPVFAIAVADLTGDGLPDIVLAGNQERCKPEAGTCLGSYGTVLQGDGKGNFQALPVSVTGLHLEGVVRDLAILVHRGRAQLVVARNDGPLALFKLAAPGRNAQ